METSYSMGRLDLQNLELIYESNRSRVYRGRQENNKPVVLKLMALDAPSVHELAQLKQEHNILVKLNHKGIIKTYGISTIAQRTALALEDFGGMSLAQALTKQTLTLDIALDIAIKTCDALAVLHQNNIIHKDINPSNIVWNKASGEVKIIDFNMATTLSREIVEFKSLNLLEGTLPYIAPEQTGRMNRAVDYRSDLYSFGATLYHLFTGKLPFEAEGEIGFVHAHIAKEPLSPHKINLGLPLVLSKIILKLLAKNAEDRYQSSIGLKRDLEKCLQEWQSRKSISEFSIAENDVPDKFRLPQKLYGREKEVQKLLSSFKRVNKTGQAEVLLVAGYAGVGKTTLVQEVHKPITESNGYFISGKFDQLQRDIPYSGFVQAFDELTKQFLSEREEELSNWKEKLLKVLDINSGVITEIIPSLEKVIGKQPEAIKLPPEQTKNRFKLVFQNFVSTLAQSEHPLTIFLDDLQWADYASLELIEHIYLRSDDKSLLLIGAYRDNEVSPTHKFNDTLKQLKENGATLEVIDLPPLANKDLEEMLANALYTKEVKSLARLLNKHTQGNPYFIREFLKELYIKEALYFSDGNWQWDVEQIEAQGFTDNIVELMLGRVKILPKNTKELLTKAACIGSNFELAILATVTNKSQEEILKNLQPALEQDLLQKRKGTYAFAHDRVQQAAYNLIPEETKPEIHLNIGRRLLAATSVGELKDKVFDIVDQLNAGLAFVTSEQEKFKLIDLNLLAGKRAKASAAYQPALAYLQTALQLLGDNSWNSHYELSLHIHEEALESAALSSNYDFVDVLFNSITKNSKSTLDKVNCYKTKIKIFTSQKKFKQATDYGLDILKQLDIHLPKSPNNLHTFIAFLKGFVMFNHKGIAKLASLPKANNPKVIAIISTLDILSYSTALSSPKLFLLVIKKQLDLQFKHGYYSPFPYAAWAIFILIGKLDKIELGYQLGKLAISFKRDDGNLEVYANTWYLFSSMILPWKKHFQEVSKDLEEVCNYSLRQGFAVGPLALSSLHLCSFHLGKQLLALKENFDNSNPTFLQNKQTAIYPRFCICWQSVLNLLGETISVVELSGPIYNEKEASYRQSFAKNLMERHWFFFFKMFLGYLFESNSTIEHVINFDKTKVPYSTSIKAVGNFYSSLIRLALYETTKESKLVKAVVKSQKKMKIWAQHAPMNYLHKWHLVEAEKCRVFGKDNEAWFHYKEAIEGALENNYVNEEALALELTAKFFLKKNDQGLAGHYMRESYSAYTRWGAVAKLKHLEKSYPQLLIEPFSLHSNLPVKTGTSFYASSSTKHGKLDIASFIQASQTISSELKLDSLLDRLMRTLIENAAAQKGFLLLPKVDDPEIWIIKAFYELEQKSALPEITLEKAEGYLPVSLIRFVIRSKEQVNLTDASESEHYHQDPYVISEKPKSVMALPLIHQGKLVGIVYLENNLAVGAFSEDRVEVLTLLSTQAAISLQNALLLSELQNKITQLEISRKRLVQIEENQRRDLAEHLHNRVQGTLLTACFKIDDCISRMLDQEEESLKVDMQEVSSILETLQEKDIRQLSHMLHPSIINICLIPAIESLLDDLPKNLKVELKVDQAIAELDNPKDNKLTESFRLTVYRIIEEALLNIRKHAKASEVSVSLYQDTQDLVLEIIDDGCGFDEAEVGPHLGLYSIDDRVSLVKGSWKIASKPNQGTNLLAKLPLPRAA